MKIFKYNGKKIKKVKKPVSNHSRTSKLIIIVVIISLFGYTGLAMWLQYKTNIEISPTLTTCYFAFCTGELWMLASIKKSKLKTGQKDNQYKIMDYGNKDDDDEPVG